MNEGDWICCDPQCGNVNFARRTSCNRCGKETSVTEKAAIPQRKKLGHEIGKAAAEKSRGLFSADDWQCGRCGNVNWARRQQCNMCNAPKFGEVEERTGLGGGYNERENVEYIERGESDSEYDDFGRKKKKYRGNEDEPVKGKTDERAAEEKNIPIYKANNEDEEEEEEEDDDDADLSKYDLTGWGDDSSPKNDDKKHSPSRSHSSASSRSEASSRSCSASSSNSSRSSRSSTPSSSDSEKPSKKKRSHSRSRSESPEYKTKSKRRRSNDSHSRSPSHISNSRSRDRSASDSPVSRKR